VRRSPRSRAGGQVEEGKLYCGLFFLEIDGWTNETKYLSLETKEGVRERLPAAERQARTRKKEQHCQTKSKKQSSSSRVSACDG